MGAARRWRPGAIDCSASADISVQWVVVRGLGAQMKGVWQVASTNPLRFSQLTWSGANCRAGSAKREELHADLLCRCDLFSAGADGGQPRLRF
jgi:hypothetical protein